MVSHSWDYAQERWEYATEREESDEGFQRVRGDSEVSFILPPHFAIQGEGISEDSSDPYGSPPQVPSRGSESREVDAVVFEM